MKNAHRVPISVLKIEEDPLPHDPGLSALEASIKENGVTLPIIVEGQTGNVIDGARRVRVMRKLRITHVAVQEADTFEQACEYINACNSKTVRDGSISLPIEYRRTWRYYSSIRELLLARRSRLRHERKVQGIPVNPVPARTLVANALQIPEGNIVVLIALHNGTVDPDPDIRKTAEQLLIDADEGRATLYEARGKLERARREKVFPRSSVSTAEQVAAFPVLVDQLNGIARGVRNLGDLSRDIPQEVLTEVLESLTTPMRDIRILTSNLRRRIKENVSGTGN